MGVLITIGGGGYPVDDESYNGVEYAAAEYSLNESGTPLYAGDTSGGVGSVTIVIPVRDRDVNPNELNGKTFSITDSVRGVVKGIIVGVDTSASGGIATLTGIPRFARLNIYNVKAEPFVGTLADAFLEYLSYAKITELEVDASIDSGEVVLPGWSGDLWTHLKMLCAAYQLDMTATGSKVIVRRARTRIADLAGSITRETTWAPAQRASAVEVWQYDTQWKEGDSFYPVQANAGSPISLTAGQPTRTVIELRGSVMDFLVEDEVFAGKRINPEYNENMAHYATSRTQFCVTYGNGKRLTEAQWRKGGGRLTVVLNPDTQTATVIGVGPVGVFADGDFVQSFSVSVRNNGITYDALRIRARGALITKTKHTIQTGVLPADAETDVAQTVDNLFIRAMAHVAEAGVDYATLASGGNWTGTAQVSNIAIDATGSTVPVEQQIGNVGGARFYDERTNSWFRIRQSNVNNQGITIASADVDNTFGDVAKNLIGMTYEDATAAWYDGLTYEQARGLGVVGG